MAETVENIIIETDKLFNPKFIDASLLTYEQLNDPDYRLKSLQKGYENTTPISCSKCHHCR